MIHPTKIILSMMFNVTESMHQQYASLCVYLAHVAYAVHARDGRLSTLELI